MEISAAVAALLGALIGAASSLLTIIIQQRFQNKRELLKIASELALQDYKRRFEVVVEKGGGKMPPISAFVHYHMRVLEHMAAGTYTPAVIKQLGEENDRVLTAYIEASENRMGTKGRAT